MRIILLCFSIVCVHVVCAQPDFRDGYIINSFGDTILLKVDYRFNANTFEKCRTKNGTTIAEYGPEDILGYGFVNDKFFQSGIIPGSFVELLVRGDLTLLRHHQKFYFWKDDELRVIQESSLPSKSQLEPSRKDFRWKGFVRLLIADCLKSDDVLEKLSVSERSLTKLAIHYNQCKGTPFTVYKKEMPWIKILPGIVVGMTSTTLTLTDQTNNPLLEEQYQSLNPVVGVVTGISFPRISTRVSLQPELHFSQASYSSTNFQQVGVYPNYYDTYINIQTVSLPVLIKYSLIERKYIVQLTAGMNLDFHTQAETRFVQEVLIGTDVYTTETEEFVFKKRHAGYMAGIHLLRSFPKFTSGVVIRYSKTEEASKTEVVSISYTKVSMGIILQLK